MFEQALIAAAFMLVYAAGFGCGRMAGSPYVSLTNTLNADTSIDSEDEHDEADWWKRKDRE